ncbi:MAG: biotin/lipoyl-binding protein, partial [Peptoniphilus grossensis]
VKVGELVKKGDVIAQLDSSSIEQQLKSRRAQKSATDKNLSAQISAAKKRLDEAISGRDSGKNPAIVAAETSLTQAMDQYLAAQKSYDDFKRSLDQAYNQGMVAEKSARENLAYQEEATDLKYRQLQDDMNKNANKIADNRALAADKARQEAYLQNALDNEKRRLTELGISIKEEQGRLAEAQEKVASLQSDKSALQARKDQLNLQKSEEKDPQKLIEIENELNKVNSDIIRNQGYIEAINFEEIKKSANENINRLTRTQNEVEIEVNRISEDLATAKADQQKYTSEAEAMEKELEGQGKQVDATRLEVKKAKEDLSS